MISVAVAGLYIDILCDNYIIISFNYNFNNTYEIFSHDKYGIFSRRSSVLCEKWGGINYG